LPAQSDLPAKTVLQTTLAAVAATRLPYHVERQAHAGMGDTIAAAVAKTQDANGWLILPADMPLIDPNAILAVAKALEESIVLPLVNGQRGHPVGFPKNCQADLLQLRGDEGARALFQKYQTKKIHADEMPSVQFPEGCLIDMDTLADLDVVSRYVSPA
jgi:molybdenum cofactor cytidylyltransferase